MMKKLYSLLLILTPIKKVYVNVDNICSNKLWRNAEERFNLKIISWGQRSGNKNKPPFND